MEEHGSFRLVLACGIYFYLLHFILCADRERSLPQQSSPSLYFPEQDGRGDSEPWSFKKPLCYESAFPRLCSEWQAPLR